jgi:hypothetical protein
MCWASDGAGRPWYWSRMRDPNPSRSAPTRPAGFAGAVPGAVSAAYARAAPRGGSPHVAVEGHALGGASSMVYRLFVRDCHGTGVPANAGVSGPYRKSLDATVRLMAARCAMQGGIVAKLAVVAAAGAGLYLASHYSNDRSVSNWATSAVSSGPKEPLRTEPARASSASQQRLTAEPGSCESQTWPNIAPECITGQAEPAKVAERSAANKAPRGRS